MNQVILSGNITKDIELKTTQTGNEMVQNSIAVNRAFKDKDGNNITDFINFNVYGATAKFLSTYAYKGCKILLTGQIQTGTYQNKDGKNVNTVNVIADKIEILSSKQDRPQPKQPEIETAPVNANDNLPPVITDDMLPF